MVYTVTAKNNCFVRDFSFLIRQAFYFVRTDCPVTFRTY